ncbi:MAG: hypothetical protein ACRDTT_00350 [Pseudonocardiaceae bacterium]
MSAQIGDTAWYLVGMPEGGASCDHCGRELKHLYRVVNPGGTEMTVGRGCVKKITGWTLSYAQAQRALRVVRRCAEIDRREAIAAARYPGLAADYTAVQDECRAARADGFDPLSGYARVSEDVRRSAGLFTTAITEDHLWRGEGWADYLRRYAVTQ